jgi:hypothetical protein
MVYVGVDLHRKRSHVVALDPDGEVVLSRRIGNAPAVAAPHAGGASDRRQGLQQPGQPGPQGCPGWPTAGL